MKQEFDFHMHTTFSDGEYDVHELINLLKKENIKYFSITDHDSINSSKEVLNEDLNGLNYITGVEISTIYNNKYKMHILGYNYELDSPYIKEINEKVRIQRIKRLYEMVNELKRLYNITISNNEIESIINSHYIVGKPHLSKILIDKGYSNNVGECIDKYLNNLNISTLYRIDFNDVVSSIHKSNGKVILAHPKKVELKYNIDINDIIDELIDNGLDGIEVYNTYHSINDSIRYEKICKDKNILISGGSDYHGPNIKPNVKLGVLNNEENNDIINIENISIYKKE